MTNAELIAVLEKCPKDYEIMMLPFNPENVDGVLVVVDKVCSTVILRKHSGPTPTEPLSRCRDCGNDAKWLGGDFGSEYCTDCIRARRAEFSGEE